MKRVTKRLILVTLCAILSSGTVCAITITVFGTWDLIITDLDLQGGAGDDFNPSYESAIDAVTVDIGGIHPFNQNYRVDVSKVDSTWHSNFHLYVRRTSEGSGHNKSSISGGITYQEVTDIDQTFFSGLGGRSGITIQLNLTGVSIQVPPDSYVTTIYYTALEI